jgi:glycosyltransferase involved in cell wall biosynthesis
MRLLHLAAGNLYGGVETYLVTLARCRGLCPGMEPQFGLCFRGRLWDELTAAGVPVHDLGPVRVSRPWTVLRARRRLRRVLREGRLAAAVVHSGWVHAVFAAVVRRAGVRLVHAVHSEFDPRDWQSRWAARTLPDAVAANSRFTAGPIAGLFPGVPVEVVYPPVPEPAAVDREAARREVRAEVGTPADAVVVLMVSRIEGLKGHAVLVDAAARLPADAPWECWVVGGAQRPHEVELLAALKKRAADRGVAGRVRFLGPRADVPRVLAAADVYCQPNTGPEGFGLTFVEALFAGLPVVTSGFGGAAEIVDGSCGVLTPPGDPAAVADAVAGLIRDPDRRRALGSAGPARARELCDPARQLARLAVTAAGPGG